MIQPVTDQELSALVEQMPPVATVIQRLLAVLRDPLSEVSDIARLVLVDTTLATQVLRLANSPHYGLEKQVSSIDQAIQHVGVNEITRLATTLSARQLFQRPLTRYKLTPHLMWHHTLAVAVGAEIVAQRLFGDTETAYLAGLLHGIGFIALDGVAAARNLAPRPAKKPLLEWERETFGTDNAATAARLLHHWGFPPAIAQAVGNRYEVPNMETIAEPGGLLYTASFLAETIPAGLPPEAGLFFAPTKALEAFIVRPAEIRDFEFAVRQKLSRLRTMLNLA
jgi:HD-like signal output (HDOD) protein